MPAQRAPLMSLRLTAAPQNPLRFVWQIDAEGRFSLISDEFLRIAGAHTAAIQGRPWSEVARALDLDPHGRIAEAIAERETFSGIVALWPLDEQTRGRVELSGMPIFDAARNFAGYRGFGIYRQTASPPGELKRRNSSSRRRIQHPINVHVSNTSTSVTASEAPETLSHPETEIVEPPQNVVPFPLANETRMPSLSAVENHAFDEIARRLTEKFDERGAHRPTGTPGIAEMLNQRAALRADRTRGAGQGRTAGVADRGRDAGAWRQRARPDAARPDTVRHSDLPARPAALRQPRISRSHGIRQACTRCRRPAVSTRCTSSPGRRQPAAHRTRACR